MKKILVALLFLFSTASARGGEIALHADYLYWTARQEGLKYTNRPTDIFTSSNFANCDLTAPRFDWNSGFRLGAAYAPDCPCWLGKVEYTQISNNAHGCKKAGKNEGIFPTLLFDAADESFAIFPQDYVSKAKAEWNLDTYILDLMAGYEVNVTGCASIIPSIGLRNAWINQKVQAVYTGGGLFTAGPCHVSLKSKFYGVGPRFGLKPVIGLGYGVDLYAEAAASLFYSRLNIRQCESFLKSQVAELHLEKNHFRWNGDFKIGLNWARCAYFLDAGFDYLYFSKQYEFEQSREFSLPRSLHLYGIHVSGGIQF